MKAVTPGIIDLFRTLRVCQAGRGSIAGRSPRLDRAEGYGYAWRPALRPPAEAAGLERGRLG
jgi:hypothetical protein